MMGGAKRVVVITGASSGIGEATAEAFARRACIWFSQVETLLPCRQLPHIAVT
jgi:NAD(P)-dependent dehydrogenase (short-subunit alcohol dehydrogenase family)